MRIQHNIMAMNSYRNYANNTNAIAKNLEKLSSGYRINRAGDDAAGLAISEKMRAQITGLATAQKNAKDGISLIQTAEGALTEVHSMLNRMFELAEQSANGTYDNEVDRANLQKEFDALRSEIDRIADSSNFNGQKLLDGSLAVKEATSVTTDYNAGGKGSIPLPGVGNVLGADTILHVDGVAGGQAGAFSVELHAASATVAIGDTIELTLGEGDGAVKVSYEATASGTLDANDIATNLLAEMTGGKIVIDGQEFTVTKTDNKLTFTQSAAPTSEDQVVNGSMKVTMNVIAGDGSSATQASGHPTTVATTGSNVTTTIDYNAVAGFSADELAKLTAAASSAGAASGTVTLQANGDLLEMKIGDTLIASADLNEIAGKAATVVALTFTDMDGNTFGLTVAGGTTSHADLATLKTTFQNQVSTGIAFTKAGDTVGSTYNIGTTNIVEGLSPGSAQYASTVFEMTEQMVRDGATIKLGTDTYTFAVGADSAQDLTAAGVIDLTGMELGDEGLLEKAAELLTKAASANAMFTVGNPGQGTTISLHEKVTAAGVTQTVGHLKTMDQFQNYVQCSYNYSETVDTAAQSGLMLQIGDTSESFNILEVSVDDMHCASLGIDAGKINISEQGMSQNAMDSIKNAINMVSSTRGDLGALQNRLDHTINNLSVMEENIQDAEANIRDTDVAKEMMAYTKNNILIQSAQAMLAQANQIPQGVLQLLG